MTFPALPATWFYVSAGVVLGLSSAISPGPLMALLVSETLCQGPRAGTQIACVPPLTDFPIIVLSLAVFSRLAGLRPIVGIVSLCGAGYLVWLAYGNLFGRGLPQTAEPLGTTPLRKGLLVNLLNPYAYLFWFTVGAPMVLEAWPHGWLPTAAFFVSLYLLLVGCNLVLVALVSRSRRFLHGEVHLAVLRVLGVCLLVFAGLFAAKGLRALGWL